MRRLRYWIADHFIIFAAILVLIYLFLPVAYTFVFSFNNYKKSNISWNPEGSPTLKHWQNPCGPPGLCDSLITSRRCGSRGSSCRRVTWWPPACPTRPRSGRGCRARPARACT